MAKRFDFLDELEMLREHFPRDRENISAVHHTDNLTPISRHFLVYWKPDQIQRALAEGKLLKAASEQFGNVTKGETLWICGNGTKGDLITIGYIVVDEVIDQAESDRRFPSLRWKAKYHACAETGKVVSTKGVSLSPIISQLRFVSNVSTKLDLARPLGNQLQRKRTLTLESALLLKEHWESACKSDV